MKNALQTSGLPVGKTLSDPPFKKSKIEIALSSLGRERIVPGTAGCRENASSRGLGSQSGAESVAFLSTDRLLDLLKRDETPERKRVSRRRHMVASLLVIDEMGFQAMDRADAHRFFQVINYRNGRARSSPPTKEFGSGRTWRETRCWPPGSFSPIATWSRLTDAVTGSKISTCNWAGRANGPNRNEFF